MSSVVISGDTSGSITLSAPAVAGSNTITLPAATGTVMVSGNMPAFSAYKSGSTQSITSSTWTKVTFDVEEYDTNNNFSSSRFTPTVAGYYQVNASIDMLPSSGTATRASTRIYQNGSAYKNGTELQISNITEVGVIASALVYCNGSTDYIEMYALMTGTTPSVQNYGTYFQASMVRAA